ncbi:MAG TPA: phosphate regulon sensor histidine kinase PhoR [Casimicrobiaceae bacterium]|nr:phosphate regulon sensor histidine kinase PhoR [Casimicrobiaceae bacterium]
MSPTLLSALLGPIVVAAVAGVAWAAAGTAAALVVLAVGWGAIIVRHARNLDRLANWAGAALDAPVPEGTGPWQEAFAALYRRVRTGTAYQRDLAHTIERFQSAAEAIPDGMVVLDTTNRIKWANARAQLHLGLDGMHDVGSPLMNIVRQPEFVRFLESGDFTEPIVIESQRKAGVTLAIQIVPFGVDEKLMISRDITRMEAVARMRRDFIANVSHELKTPLTVIAGFLETLQELDLDEKQRERFIQLMQEQSSSMQRLVEDLLTLSALESEQNPLVDEPFAIVGLLLQLSSDAKGLSQGQHAVALDIGDAATVLGSRDELASAFGNLVSNAIRYTPPRGTIALSWRVDDNGTGVFAVTDSGIGISPEHVPRLTERFYRIDRSRSRATGGTGLGLAIVKHVLLRHQASLEITSETGKGSTFAVRLPARRVQRAPVPAESPALSTSSEAPRGTAT